MPKLAHRIDIARDTCATLARAMLAGRADERMSERRRSQALLTLRAVSPAVVLTLEEEYQREVKRKLPMRVVKICTLEEAIEFVRENPAR